MATPTPPTAGSGPSLKRALTLRDLILYGVIVIQPVAPDVRRSACSTRRSRGHAVTTILIAMVAMLLTAISYGRMARVYPSAGSAFTYVGKEIHPAAGYVTGWSMVMDYMLNPMICILWCSKGGDGSGARDPGFGAPFAVWAVLFFALFTALNLRGIEASARFNTVLAAAMGVVIVVFLAAAVRYIFGHARGGQRLYPAVLRPPALELRARCWPGPRSPCSPTSASTASRPCPRRSRTRGATSCWPPCSAAW